MALLVLFATATASHAFASPWFSQPTKQAVFLSPLENWYQTWNLDSYISPLEAAGYRVDVLLNENVSFTFLKTGLSKYDIIILRTDSFAYEGEDFFCLGEPVTFKTATTYTSEISSKELQVAACLGFSPKFIQSNYPAGSLHGLVYVLASRSSSQLSSVFISACASVFVGYDQDFSLRWGRMDALSQAFFRYLSEGYPVKDATIQLYIYLHTGHGHTANWLSPYYVGNGDFKI